MGYHGQSGSYTDIETLHAAGGLYTALSGPVGIYYNPESGVGMARSRADALNTYDQLLHPFDGWTFGAYAHQAGQFLIGEGKGAVNFVTGSLIEEAPSLDMADQWTGSHLSHPIAASNPDQAAGDAAFPWVVAGAGGIELLAAGPAAAEELAGAESQTATSGGRPFGGKMQRGFAMVGWKKNISTVTASHEYGSYEQARNAALDWLEERGFRFEKPVEGRLGPNAGKTIGRSTADGNVGFRIEYDGEEKSGAHINVFDHNAPKLGKARNLPYFKFPGDQKSVDAQIKHLAR